MRISDWSSDVCSSDLQLAVAPYFCTGHPQLRVPHQRHQGGIEPYRHVALAQTEQCTGNECVAGPDVGSPGISRAVQRIADQRGKHAGDVSERTKRYEKFVSATLCESQPTATRLEKGTRGENGV